jgi:DNA-binding cell septation regulator SpoVG
MENFRVLEIRKIQKSDVDVGLVAFADVEFFGVLVVRNFRIIRSRNGQTLLLGLPLQYYYDKGATSGIKKRTVIKLPEELKGKIYAAILEEWDRVEKLKFQKDEGGQ